MEWSEFLEFNDLYTHVVLRKLIYSRKESIKADVMEVIGENLGKKY